METEEYREIEQSKSCDEQLARAIVTVISLDGETARVESAGTASCSRCASTGGCGTKSLLALFGTKPVPLELENNLGAKVGDQIEIGIEQTKILKLSALSYLMPLVGLFGGGALGAVLRTSDLIGFGLGLAGLAVGFGYSRYLYTSERWEKEILPVCVRLVASGDEQYINIESIG